jgi:hypothetical protein
VLKVTHAYSGYCIGKHMQTEQLTWHYDDATIELGLIGAAKGRYFVVASAQLDFDPP